MAQFKRFNSSDNPTRSDTTAAYPTGTLTWDDVNGLRLHDGETLGGNAIGSGGGGGGSIGSFGTDLGIGSGYAANNPAVLFSDDDMIIRTGGTSGHGTIGAMYIASSEELLIGHATTALTDNTAISSSTFGTYINFDGNGMNLTSSITTADIQLQTTNGVYNHSWNFSHEGKIVFPNSNLLYSGQSTGETNLQIIDGTSSFKIYTHATSGAREWDFAADGSFTVPGVINSQAGTGPVTINSNDGATTRTWTFGTDGSLTIPNLISSTAGQYYAAVSDTSTEMSTQFPWAPSSNVYSGMGSDGSGVWIATTTTDSSSNSTDHNWRFGFNGAVTFPDGTQQTTAYSVPAIGPVSAWGTNTPTPGPADSYTFYFDPTTGYPSMISSAWGGNGNPIWHSIWNVESWQQASGPTYSSSYAIAAGQPAEVGNIYPIALLGSALEPGDYTVVRIQDIDNNRIYRATFMGTWNPGTMVDTTHYGSITVERLF